MRRKDVKKWLAGCGLIFFFSLFASGTAMAEWRNIDKGPGGAEWVDENGNVIPYSEYKKEKEEMTVLEENVEQESQEAVQETETAVQETEAVLGTSERVIDPSRPMVALTFDDGPYAPVGNRIMDSLAQYGGKATFFVVGNRCASYAEEMQRMVAEGHEIGNHTYSHKYLDKLGASEIQSQIQRGNEAIQAVAGVPAVIVRLPGGNKNATVLANVNAPMIMWSIDTLDWKLKNAQTTIDAVLGKVRDGDIVLMHELYSSTGDAAMQIIPALVERGYQLVTVSELAQYRGGLESGKLYFNFYQ
jgi:peptidoglycan/xylan/chitin deacetylase (PgdA/CDA1 family)